MWSPEKMTVPTLTRSLGVVCFSTLHTDLFDDGFCCWVVITFTTILGDSLGNDAVIFQEEIARTEESSSFHHPQSNSQIILEK